MQEAQVQQHDHGLLPRGEGWYVINVGEAQWRSNPAFGEWFNFEGDRRFEGFGLNVHILQPGQPACMYHRENAQEGFLVLSGECLAVVEGQERRLGPWDYLHCPDGTDHVLVGGGEGPSVVLMIGARKPDQRCVYPVEEAAGRFGASVEAETPDPRQAYADTPPSVDVPAPWPERG